MPNRRDFLRLTTGAAFAQTAPRPNVLLILIDDMGYADIGCFGAKDIRTPNIDRLAREGVKLTDCYSNGPVCTPTRCGLMTGRYQQRFGLEWALGPGVKGYGLQPENNTIARYLKNAGYKTGIFGKWHLGYEPEVGPNRHGFDEFYGFLTGGNAFITTRTPNYQVTASDGDKGKVPAERDAPIYRDRATVPEDRYLTDAFADEALKFIERNRTKPFFLYFAPNAIHTPLHAITKYVDRVAGIKSEKHRLLAAMTVALDDAVGAILAKLKSTGLDRNTMVVFLSDNGSPTITGAGTNGPLNGQKVSYYEGGIRVPMLIQWPGRVPAGKVYRKPVVSRDILSTFLGADTNDGVNLQPYLRNNATPHEALFWRAGPGRAVRKGKWKLVEFGDQLSQLFDLDADIGERTDLSAKHPEVVKDLRAAWQKWSDQMAKPAWPPRFRELTVNGTNINWQL